MDQDVFDLIEQRLQSFSKGKRTIATYILQNPNEAAFQTAAIIGKTVGISESSVVRFAGDLGFRGFPEFQRALQQVAMERLRGDLPAEQHREQCAPISSELLRDAVKELLQCRGLYVLSDSLGSTLFPFCKLWGELTGESMTFLSSDNKDGLFRGLSGMEPGDLLLCLILHTSTDLLTFALEQGRRLGTRILILTDLEDPTIGSLANILLRFPRGKEGPIPDPIPCMTLLHDLFLRWSQGKKEVIAKRNKILEEIRNTYENRYI